MVWSQCFKDKVCPGRFWGVYEQLCLISKIQLGKVGPGVGAKKKFKKGVVIPPYVANVIIGYIISCSSDDDRIDTTIGLF